MNFTDDFYQKADPWLGLCEEITEKERNEIIRVTDDRNKCSPIKTKVTCQDYLKINLIDWIHWVLRIEWNQKEFAKYQENKYGTYSQGSSDDRTEGDRPLCVYPFAPGDPNSVKIRFGILKIGMI